jgi:molybdate transport system regulatory protein
MYWECYTVERVKPQLSIRVDFGPDRRLGPGKVRLLEEVAAHGSISAAGRALGMSYKRAWDLIEDVNSMFAMPVVESRSGGKQGGGATLTDFGKMVVQRYRGMEKAAARATEAYLDFFTQG